MKGRSKKQEELEDSEDELGQQAEESDEKSFKPIEMLLVNFYLNFKEQGINQTDINKLADAGFRTIESVIYTTKKTLMGVKGLSEAKVDKILEAGITINLNDLL